MNHSRLSRYAEIIILALILLVAAFLRLGWPGLTEFKADEARLFSLALDMAEGRHFALRGISSSVGFPNFPMSVWLYALPLLLWPHVYAVTLFTGLLNTLAVAACYWFVRRYWGMVAALAATLMLAVSPWAIIFSRKIWAQNLLPLFVMLWAIGAALAFAERRPRFIWLHFLALAVAVQIHLAAVALLPVTLLLLVLFRQRVDWKQALTGAGLAAATALPFAFYLWRNLPQISRLPVGETAARLDLDALRYTWMLSLGYDIHALAGPTAYTAYLNQVPNLTPVYWLWATLIILGSFWQIWQFLNSHFRNPQSAIPNPQSAIRNPQSAIPNPQSQIGLIVLLWLWLPPLFFTWHSTPVFLHYFIATLPAQYIIAGIFFAQLITQYALRNPSKGSGQARQYVFSIAWSFLAASAVAQVWLIIALLTFLGAQATPGGFGTPVTHLVEAAELAQTWQAETGAAEILIASPGESPALDETAAVYEALLRGPHRFVDVNRSALFPAMPAIVLLDEGVEATATSVADLYLAAAVRHQRLALRNGEGWLHVLLLPGAAAPPPAVSFDTPYLLSNWVSLRGFDQPQPLPDGTALWQIHWRTGDNPDPASYHFFNHLLDAQSHRIAQADAAAFSPWQWRAGDAIVSRFTLPWPETAERPLIMRTGMYTYPALQPVLLLDVAGNPYSDAAEIRLPHE